MGNSEMQSSLGEYDGHPNSDPLTDRELEELELMAKDEGKLGKIARAWLRVEEKTVPKPKDGYVYVAEADSGYVKIGKSIHPEDRIQQLSTGSPVDLTLLAKSEVAESVEKEQKVQQQYNEYRERGEWFEVPDSVKREIIETVEDLS